MGNARRGAGRLAALLALLAVIPSTLPAQDECRPDWQTLTRAAQLQETTPGTVANGDHSPDWSILTRSARRETKTAAADPPAPRITVDVYAPSWCSTCPQWRANLGDGDRDLLYRWHKADAPAGIAAQTRIVPAFVHDGKLLTRDPAGMTHADFRRLVGLPAVRPSTVAAASAGKGAGN